MELDFVYFCRMCRYVYTARKELTHARHTSICPLCKYPGVEAIRNTENEIKTLAEGKSEEELKETEGRKTIALLKKQEAMAKAREAKKARQRDREVKDAAL